MIEAIQYPGEERMRLEEDTFLTKLVELRVAIEQTRRDVLIKDTEYERWQDREDDVVERHRPRLVDRLS